MTVRGITQIRLKNFRRFETAAVRFEPGTTFVEGENNAGKTSLFYAIEYALFGRAGSGLGPNELMRPGARGVGVELTFVGRDGRAYRLQRAHLRPPRSRTKVEGHFTLWVRDTPEEPERYLLSSDFDDLETDLAIEVRRAIGTTRRGWDLAIHLRQGRIADILDGAPELDRVLGVSAAGFVEEELRAMALEREKAATELPAREATLARLQEEAAHLSARQQALEQAQQALTTEGPDPEEQALRGALDGLQPLRQLATELDRAEREASLAATAHERAIADQAALGVADGAARTRAEAELAAIEAEEVHLGSSEARKEVRTLEQELGDLEGQLRRLTALDAVCERCGQRVDPAHLAARIPELEQARDAVLTRLTEARDQVSAQAAARAALMERRTAATVALRDAEHAAAAHERAAAAVTQTEAQHSRTTHAVEQLRGQVQNAVPDVPDTGVLPALQAHLSAEHDRLRAALVRLEADRQHGASERERVTADLAQVTHRLGPLERERAAVATQCATLRSEAARAEQLRALASGFKAVQQGLRERATARLATRTLALHEHLTGSDRELDSLEVDPKRYTVHVTPRDIGHSVPAAHAQGGGHRLLLGLAARLALAEQLGPVPFVLLDEPTYGLDQAHREALLERISSLDVADQLLLVTHHDIGEAVRTVEVVRDGAQSRVAS